MVPGLPAVLARRAAGRLEAVHGITVGAIVRERNLSHGSAVDIMAATAAPATVCEDGQWRRASLTTTRRIDFGPGFGVCTCYPMDLPELRPLPGLLGLRRCAGYAAGVNGFANAVAGIWYLFGLGRSPWGARLGARALVWTNRFTRPPFGVAVTVEAGGETAGRRQSVRLSVRHDDGYVATAVPTVSCLLQMLDRTLETPGIRMMGHAVETDRFLSDMARLGMKPAEPPPRDPAP